MVANGLITEAEKEKAEKKQKKAIVQPFTSETPNKSAPDDWRSDTHLGKQLHGSQPEKIRNVGRQ